MKAKIIGLVASVFVLAGIAFIAFSANYPEVWGQLYSGMPRDEVLAVLNADGRWRYKESDEWTDEWILQRPLGLWQLRVRYNSGKVASVYCHYNSVFGSRTRNRY